MPERTSEDMPDRRLNTPLKLPAGLPENMADGMSEDMFNIFFIKIVKMKTCQVK